jgi:hypothetical protein
MPAEDGSAGELHIRVVSVNAFALRGRGPAWCDR